MSFAMRLLWVILGGLLCRSNGRMSSYRHQCGVSVGGKRCKEHLKFTQEGCWRGYFGASCDRTWPTSLAPGWQQAWEEAWPVVAVGSDYTGQPVLAFSRTPGMVDLLFQEAWSSVNVSTLPHLGPPGRITHVALSFPWVAATVEDKEKAVSLVMLDIISNTTTVVAHFLDPVSPPRVYDGQRVAICHDHNVSTFSLEGSTWRPQKFTMQELVPTDVAWVSSHALAISGSQGVQILNLTTVSQRLDFIHLLTC